MIRKLLKEIYIDEVYPENSRYSYDASLGDDCAILGIAKETYRDLAGLNSFSEISEGDYVYTVRRGSKTRIKRTVRQVSVLDDPIFIVIKLDFVPQLTGHEKAVNNFHINNINGTNVQVGENNNIDINITLSELVNKIIESEDQDAKNALGKFLSNNTIASIIGAGTSKLLDLL